MIPKALMFLLCINSQEDIEKSDNTQKPFLSKKTETNCDNLSDSLFTISPFTGIGDVFYKAIKNSKN